MVYFWARNREEKKRLRIRESSSGCQFSTSADLMGNPSLRELYRAVASRSAISYLYWGVTSALWTADKLGEVAMEWRRIHAQNGSCGKKEKNVTSGGANGS